MQNASLEAFLHLGDSPRPIPLDTSHYSWQQPTDRKGRPCSKVRFGLWSFSTSLLDEATYRRLLELMLSDTAVVDARAEYGRADGQGLFLTVWGRRCTVCHVFDYFDSRGTNGQQPAWVLYFSLAAEEMGRTAGAAGTFVLPAARSYVYVPPPPTNPKGGKGPDGMGDAVGTFSGRRYDPDNCGGPILSLSWQDAKITMDGITQVERHTSRYGEDPENQAMINRLKSIVTGEIAATDWDKRYYTHELREYARYQAMGIRDGDDPRRELWNHAHTATLEDFQLADYDAHGVHNLYHPSI